MVLFHFFIIVAKFDPLSLRVWSYHLLQAIVGDKTIAFFLMDEEMYSGMSCLNDASPTVERGIALHKVCSFTFVLEAGLHMLLWFTGVCLNSFFLMLILSLF